LRNTTVVIFVFVVIVVSNRGSRQLKRLLNVSPSGS
jgi:hypothetical protein